MYGLSGLSRQARERWIAALLLAPLLALFFMVYVGPFGNLIAQSFTRDGAFTIVNYVEQLRSASFGIIVWRTLILAIAVTVLCLLIGFPLAYVLSRLPHRLAAGLLLVVTIPYLTSILIRTYAWIVVLSPNGLINQALLATGLIEEPLRLVFNQIGVYIGMVQVQLPLMVFPLYAAMQRIDRSLIAGAQSLGSSPASAFWHVTLPLSMPGIVSGCTLVFLSCLGFYVTPALLGGTGEYMVAQGISVRVTTLADFEAAAVQATLLLAVVGLLFILLRRRIGTELGQEGGNSAVGRAQIRTGRLLRASPLPGRRLASALRFVGEAISVVRWPLLWCAAIGALVYLVLPLLIVIPLAFSNAAYLTFPPPSYSLRWFRTFFADAQWLEATWFSLEMAGAAALASALLGVPAAFALTRKRIIGRLPLYLLFISPLVLPHVVLAVALYFELARAHLIGTTWAFIVAYTVIGVPYAVVVFVAGLRRFDRTLEQAAASLGAAPLTVLRTVTLPLLAPTLASALLFAFIVAFDDVVFGLFLSGPGATPLPIRMFDDIRLEISPQIAVVAVLLFAALALLYAAYLTAAVILERRRTPTGVNTR